jgi:Transposase DDE domain
VASQNFGRLFLTTWLNPYLRYVHNIQSEGVTSAVCESSSEIRSGLAASISSPSGSRPIRPTGSGANLNWLVEDKGIAPHIPVIDKSKRDDGTFSRDDFTFDRECNVYTCPAGKALTTTGRLVNNGETVLYRASTYDCGPCPLKPKCCPKAPERRIPRSIYEEARDVARALAKTETFEQSCRDRKRVEMLFAHLKRILKLGRLRLRGPRRAQDEFTLAAIAQNLRRLAKLVVRPPPEVAAFGA